MAQLQRVEHDNGVVTLQSPKLRELDVIHAFSTRIGGVSEGAYHSLNLATLEKDERSDFNTAVAENFRRFRAAVGCERMARVAVRQVHGASVWSPPATLVRPGDAPQADAIVTDRPARMVTVRVADCVPVLLASDGSAGEGTRVIAAVHAGWRGVVAGVVSAAVKAMRDRYGVEPASLTAAVGPHIGLDHFEVGPEVAEAFAAAGLGDAVRHQPHAKPHIDLGGAVVHQLRDAGVADDRIDASTHCTYRDAELFYSYRRDGQRSGRMAAIIALPA